MSAIDNPRTLALATIFISFLVMGIKLVAWQISGSIALYSDALESTVNVIASFSAWYAIRLGQRPADDTHPFGHHKAEYFSAVFEGVLIVIAALLIIREASLSFYKPTMIDTPFWGMVVNGGAALINLVWAWLLIRAGTKSKSPALIADGRHLQSDVVTSVGVLAGLGLALMTGYGILDPILAILVAINILWQGYKLIMSSLHPLMDHALSQEDQEAIRAAIVASSDGAIEFHDLRTREAGPVRFVELHLVVDRNMTVEVSHQICDRIERALHELMPEIRVTIHVEPDHKVKPDKGIAL